MGKRKYNLYSCIVCGEGIWWPDQEAQTTDLPPACNHHTYEEVWKAEQGQKQQENKTARTKKPAIAQAH